VPTSAIPPAHIAIVGCGFTGTAAFFQLVERHPVRELTIFESSGRFGPGYAYQPDECTDYLINNTTDTMCLVPGNRRAFIEWLQHHPEHATQVDPKGHLPRTVYGAFLLDVMRSTLTLAAIKGIRVNCIAAEVTRLREDGAGVELGWAHGTVRADVALLTTGRCPDLQAFPAPPAGSALRYIATHIATDAFTDLPLDARCHVLGTSLSAYDVVNRLFSPETGCRFQPDATGALSFVPGPNARHVVLGSRSGRLKKMQSLMPRAVRRQHFVPERLETLAHTGRLTMTALLELIQAEARAHQVDVDWLAVVDPYSQCTTADEVTRRAGELLAADIKAATSGEGRNFLVDLASDAQVDLWDGFARHWLPAAEERYYRTKVETALQSFAAPCPVPTARRLLALHRAGRLEVRRGVGAVTLHDSATHYRVPHADGVDDAQVVINATGAVDRWVRSDGQSPLVASLREAGLLRPYSRDGAELPGADVDLANFRARGSRHVYVANMFLWGPGFFTSSAFMMATIVERLLDQMFAAVRACGSRPPQQKPSRQNDAS